MRSRNGARHPSYRGGMNRTRGCTGLVAAPDSWRHRTRGGTGLVAAPDSWLHRTRGCTGLVAAPDSWRHRTRGGTGLVAAPDPRPCAHSFTQSRASPPVGPVARGLWPPTFTPSSGRAGRAGRLLSVDPFPHFQFNRRRRQLSTILCISRLLRLVRSGFHPCCVCQPSPIQSISDSMTETGDTAAAVADTAVTNVDRVKRPTRPDDTETKRLIEDLQSTST
jgi:hypothetical protein